MLSLARDRSRTQRRAWVPTILPGCVLHLRADLGITLNGSTVSAWANQGTLGGSFTQATAARQPTYSAAGGAGSKPTLSFDGGDFLASSLAASSWKFLHETAHTIFIVSRVASLGANFYGLLNTGAGGTRGVTVYVENRGGAGNTRAILHYIHSGTAPVAANQTDNTYLVAAWQITELLWEYGAAGNDLSVIRDGTLLASSESTSAPSSSDPTYSLQIGAYAAGPSQGFNGTISEVIVFNRALSAAERSAARRYLGAYHSVAVS